ncbi:hypothetical protein [Achromobacter ruhlandii]|uniref:hypothetical protein n=1 Tax=Achromobacter ruhlandii TaxID=72557 RepID=UPI001B8A8D49|nr:hypothetical protein [Achromobacter ruhlandii]
MHGGGGWGHVGGVAWRVVDGGGAGGREDEGWNAWAWAIEKGAQDVADLLEKAGAEPAFPEA